MRLIENTPECPDGNFMLPRHDRRIRALAQDARELDMTALLAHFLKTGGFKATLDLRKASGLSRPNFYLDPPHRWGVARKWRLEMQLQCFGQVG